MAHPPPRAKRPHRGSKGRDGGVSAPVEVSEGRTRTCVVTREERSPQALVRVYALDGHVAVDARGRRGGRGAWLLPRREVLERAEANPALLRRALREDSLVVAGLLHACRAQVAQQLLDLLSLAARAGALASGGDSVEASLRAGSAACVLVACDASEASVARASTLAAALVPSPPLHRMDLDKATLGARIGKGPRAVVVVRPCALARAIVRVVANADSLR